MNNVLKTQDCDSKSAGSDCNAHKRAKGNTGENIACEFLKRNGFQILDRNYLKKWGELDIVAKKDISNDQLLMASGQSRRRELHFFEVKSVTCDLGEKFFDIHRAEDNVDGWKMRKLRRIIETYLGEKGSDGIETPFKFHVLCVYMNMTTRNARVKWLKDIII
jgi:putative endonuclease